MNKKIQSAGASPGISRVERISDEGLQRLEKHLASGVKVNITVLAQWVRRYGEPAREIIKHHDQYRAELDLL